MESRNSMLLQRIQKMKQNDRALTLEEKELIKKYEAPKKKRSFQERKEMYLKQTDRNYKDGDRN